MVHVRTQKLVKFLVIAEPLHEAFALPSGKLHLLSSFHGDPKILNNSYSKHKSFKINATTHEAGHTL